MNKKKQEVTSNQMKTNTRKLRNKHTEHNTKQAAEREREKENVKRF